MIAYATLGTNDMPRAQAFYAALMASIGGQMLFELAQNSNAITAYGFKGKTRFGQNDTPALALVKPYDGGVAHPGNGTMLAMAFDTRAEVAAFYTTAISLGAADEGKPGVRGEEGPRAFYGAYFRDLDGNKICAMKLGPAD